MRPLFTVVALILATTATAAIAQSQSPDSHDAAVRLIEALNWRGVMEPIRAEMLTHAKANLQSRLREELGSPTAEEYAEVDAIVDQLVSKYTLDDTIADMVPLLQAHYSTVEMRELAIFFASPVYKKFQAELPKINQEALETMNRKMQPAIQDTVNRVSVRIDTMKKARSGK